MQKLRGNKRYMNEEYTGKQTLLIKVYFYITSGVGIINDFRNIFLGLFALYFTFKLTDPWILGILFLISLPILGILGYINVHKISKVKEWLSTKYGSHYTMEQYKLSKRQVEVLEEISKKLP